MGKVNKAAAFFLSLMIKSYRYCLSPFFGTQCRFTPTCSEYSLIALEQYGFAKGCWFMVRRLLRCHPWKAGGYDPVPNLTDREKI